MKHKPYQVQPINFPKQDVVGTAYKNLEDPHQDKFFLFYNQCGILSMKIAAMKEAVLKDNLPKDLSKCKSTSFKWAMDRIIKFQKDNELGRCEVMGINNKVFCFGIVVTGAKVMIPHAVFTRGKK
jgi:hypothetical protein